MDNTPALGFLNVADTLETLLTRPHPHVLDMEAATVVRIEECNTYACIAGSYLLAEDCGAWSVPIAHEPGVQTLTRGGAEADYHKGALLMAEGLGFDSVVALLDWAEENPELWGNAFGYLMFESNMAWGGDPELTLADCVRHLRGVAARITAAGVAE